METEEICQYIGADSLHYITMDGMFAALKSDAGIYCAACFSGDYPAGEESI
jgi:amidophosphoribosyltransferase